MTSSVGCSGLKRRGFHYRGDPGEVLEQDARRHEGDLGARQSLGVPFGQGLDILGADRLAVLVAEQVFQQDFQGIRKAGRLGERPGDRVEAEDGILLIADPKECLTAEMVDHDARDPSEKTTGGFSCGYCRCGKGGRQREGWCRAAERVG
jgi:hypothetical protein